MTNPEIGTLVKTPSGERGRIKRYWEPAPGIIRVRLDSGHITRYSRVEEVNP